MRKRQHSQGLDQIGYNHWLSEDEIHHVTKARSKGAKAKKSITDRVSISAGSRGRKPPTLPTIKFK